MDLISGTGRRLPSPPHSRKGILGKLNNARYNRWLLEQAQEEAILKEDNFHLAMFVNMVYTKMTKTQTAFLEEYLFPLKAIRYVEEIKT